MAEILAQNSRMLADAIIKQEKLAEDVYLVKGKVADVEVRLECLEAGSLSMKENMETLNNRLTFLDIEIDEKYIVETLAWCENISCSKGRIVIRSDSRENTLFTLQTIDEAISIMKDKNKLLLL